MAYPRKRGLVHDYLSKRSAGIVRPWSFFETVRGSRSFVQRLEILSVLTGHDGCVNSVAWNDQGSLLLSGSDDCFLNIYEPWSEKCLYSMRSGHTANIFSAKFLPCTSDKKLVSCSGDGMVHYNELGNESYYGQHPFRCHVGTTYEVLVTPGDPHTFLTCGEDGTVREFDLRIKNKCICNECTEDILIDCSHAVTSMSINPLVPYQIAVGCEDSNVRIFDRRTLSTSPESRSSFVKGKPMRGMFSRLKPDKLRSNRCRVTSLQYSQNGYDLLVSYCADYIYLFTLNQNKPISLKTHHSDKTPFAPLSEDVDDIDGSSNLPPLKRLRLRGDWSDTGPNARPENEQGESSENSLLQRMSEVFTSWLEDAFRASLRSTSSSGESSQSEDARPERPRSGTRGRLILGSLRIDGRRGRSMRGANRSRASSSDSDQPLPRIPTPVPNMSNSFTQLDSPNEIGINTSSPSRQSTSETNLGECICPTVPSPGVGHASALDTSNSNFSRETFMDGHCSNSDVTSVAAGNASSSLTIKVKDSLRMNSSRSLNSEISNSVNNLDCEAESVVGNTYSFEDTEHNSLPEDSLLSLNCDTSNPSHEIENSPLRDEQISEMYNADNSSTSLSTCEATLGYEDNLASIVQGPSDGQFEETGGDEEEREHASMSHRLRSSRNHSHYNRSYLDENAAATRIQNFMRKHKESKLDGYVGNDVKLLKASKCYKGHRNARTMIKEANFWGEHFVISGSDCGRIFIWNRHTAELVTFMSGDRHVVNCVQPHPFDPVLASSGIDYDIKLWAPVLNEPNELADIDEVIRRNEQMLEESRDTITVPASFMLRMLASLSHVRGRRRQQDQADTSESDNEN